MIFRHNSGQPINGLFIAGLGLPGSGKSSVLGALANRLDCTFYAEPEEAAWPPAVTDRALNGCFSAITWFRTVRVPQLFAADKLRASGQIVVVDSYFDKAMHYCLGKAGMEWLIDSQDPYFAIVKQMMALDVAKLPDADCIVCFIIDKQDWLELLKVRGRHLDSEFAIESTFATQQHYIEAAKQLAKTRGIRCIEFKQTVSCVEKAADSLYDLLIDKEVILNPCLQSKAV